MVENQRGHLQDISHEWRNVLIGQYRQAFEAFQQTSDIICKGGFSEGNAKEITLEFYNRYADYSSPLYSSIRNEVGFGDRNNEFAPRDYQTSTEIIEEIEKAGSWRKASMDLLEQGLMVINTGGGDEECDIVGWNFIRLGLYLQPKILAIPIKSEPQLQKNIQPTTEKRASLQGSDVGSPDTVPFLGTATENEVRDSIRAELKQFVRRRTLRQKIKEEDIPLLLNLKMVGQDLSKRGLEGTRNRRFLLDALLGDFITDLKNRDVQSNNKELTGSEILFRNYVLNDLHEKIAEQLDVTYPTTYLRRRSEAIDRLTYELIALETGLTHRMI